MLKETIATQKDIAGLNMSQRKSPMSGPMVKPKRTVICLIPTVVPLFVDGDIAIR
jgi:hypothetical protein